MKKGSVKATITKKMMDKEMDVEEERIKYLIKYEKNKSIDEVMEVDEDIVAYNQILDYIEARHMTEIDNLYEGETWRFKEIRGHQGPLTPKDKDYQGSRYNVMIAWEDGTESYIPLSWVQDPVTCADYAQGNGLLNAEGWKRFRRLANREKT